MNLVHNVFGRFVSELSEVDDYEIRSASLNGSGDVFFVRKSGESDRKTVLVYFDDPSNTNKVKVIVDGNWYLEIVRDRDNSLRMSDESRHFFSSYSPTLKVDADPVDFLVKDLLKLEPELVLE